MFAGLIVLIVVFALGAVVALVRGLVAFSREGERIKGSDNAHLRRGEPQNRMMTQRVMFQAAAISAVVLVGLLFSAR